MVTEKSGAIINFDLLFQSPELENTLLFSTLQDIGLFYLHSCQKKYIKLAL